MSFVKVIDPIALHQNKKTNWGKSFWVRNHFQSRSGLRDWKCFLGENSKLKEQHIFDKAVQMPLKKPTNISIHALKHFLLPIA